jgi:hypothetical protein
MMQIIRITHKFVAGTITSNTDVLTLGHAAIIAGTAVDLNGNELILDADADTSITSDTDDTIHIKISGADDFTFTANTFTAESGSTIAAQALTATTVTASGIVKTDDATDATSTTDGSLQTDGGLSVVKDSVFGDDIKLLSDSAVIHFGADSEVTLSHSADSGVILKHTATADDKPINLILQTGETDMAANDVIGKISFQAPDEGTGTDAILISAAIQARAEGDHSSSSNATSLDFMTGASEAAAKKMSLTSAGHLLPASDDAQDLGSGSLQWRDVYTGDLNLNNTRHRKNEVDGTSGSWTIQEGSNDLFLLNRINGKKYKFNLTEVK